MVSGLFLLGFVAFQLWGTGLEQDRGQARLTEVLAEDTEDGVQVDAATVDVGELAERLAEIDPATAPPVTAPPEGEPVGIIQIPRIDLQRVIVEGVSKADLKKGPGHYPATPLPGQPGNTGIAGHRTTYGAPFNRIDELRPGDEITVDTAQGHFTYEVVPAPDSADRAWYTVKPSQVEVLRDFGDDRITLTACHPKYSARERIVVHAVLRSEPAKAAPAEPGTSGKVEQAAVRDTAQQLDEGMGGDTSALPRAIAYAAAALAVALLAWLVGRLWRRWPAYVLATPAVLALVWFCYLYLDRYLPSF